MNLLDSKLRLITAHKDLTHSSSDGLDGFCRSMDEFTNNWLVFPYHEESVLNLRLISAELDLPTINEIFIRTHYDSDLAFEAAIQIAAIKGNKAFGSKIDEVGLSIIKTPIKPIKVI